jgi:hypothetical protein
MIFYRLQRSIFYAAIAVAVCMIGACSYLPWQVLPTDAGVEQLCNDHRYVTALKVLDARQRNISDYGQKRAAVIAAAQSYQAELLQRADDLVQQQQFAKAEMLIDLNRAELPPSADLAQFDAQFTAMRDRYIQHWLDDLVELRAPSLTKEHNAYQALLKGANTPEIQSMLARHQADVDYFAPLIAGMGSQALAQNDYEKAARYLAIANQLTPSPTLEQQLKIAEQAMAASKQKQQRARTNVREQRYRDLRNVLEKSIRDRDFFAARDALAEAKALNIHGDELDAMRRELDTAIGAFVAQQIDAGNHQYADGYIEAALKNWISANALMPTPELQEKIDRAQKFVDRLEQLQKSAK